MFKFPPCVDAMTFTVPFFLCTFKVNTIFNEYCYSSFMFFLEWTALCVSITKCSYFVYAHNILRIGTCLPQRSCSLYTLLPSTDMPVSSFLISLCLRDLFPPFISHLHYLWWWAIKIWAFYQCLIRYLYCHPVNVPTRGRGQLLFLATGIEMPVVKPTFIVCELQSQAIWHTL